MKYEDLLKYVSPEVPGCPNFQAIQALRDAAIEFCIRTDIWIQPLESLQVVANVYEYDLSPAAGAEINHVLKVYRGESALSPVAQLNFYEVLNKQPSAPSCYSQSDSDTLMLAPIPVGNETLKILYSLKPTQASTSIPDAIAKENAETLAHGALYRLQMMQEQTWTKVESAERYKRLFDRTVSLAVRKVKLGYVGAPLTVYPRSFG